MNKQENANVSLENAPKAVQLAVDLIQLLEENNVETEIAVDALQFVLNDFKNKLQLNK